MKVATMRLLEERAYPTTIITTFNADVNAPMIAVNVALGAHVAGAMVSWRKHLGGGRGTSSRLPIADENLVIVATNTANLTCSRSSLRRL